MAAAGHVCYHCKQWVDAGAAHDCWTTTEAALTRDLAPDLQDAWERLRETAADFGPQRIYASHKSIMFSRTACYFFVRPKRSALEICIFLGRAIKAPQVRRADQASRTKIYNIVHVRHRDEVEAPLTDWLQEAYAFAGQPRQGAVDDPPKKKKAAVKSAAAVTPIVTRKASPAKRKTVKPAAKRPSSAASVAGTRNARAPRARARKTSSR